MKFLPSDEFPLLRFNVESVDVLADAWIVKFPWTRNACLEDALIARLENGRSKFDRGPVKSVDESKRGKNKRRIWGCFCFLFLSKGVLIIGVRRARLDAVEFS